MDILLLWLERMRSILYIYGSWMDMLEKIFFFNLFLLITLTAHTQKRNNVWAFGKGGGMNFNTPAVTSFKSQANAEFPPYYMTSICDSNGNLMFYTDGWSFWNKDHFPLVKYNNWAAWSGNIMPLICPYPGNDSLFYTFAVCDGINKYQFQYISTRIKESGDIEEIIYPRPVDPTKYRTVLRDDASLVVAGTAHCNQRDYWIVTHSQDALYAFLVTKNGVNTTPVVSKTFPLIAAGKLNVGWSNIKFSANSEKFTIPLVGEAKILVYDFNNQTGVFNNPIKLNLPVGQLLEDVEFSPDGTKLYAGIAGDLGEGISHNIAQWDLNAGNSAQVESTLTVVNQVPDQEVCTPHICYLIFRSMQLGPDGKIYVSMRYVDDPRYPIDKSVSVIEEPNKKGALCRFLRNEISIDTKYMFLGYNYIRSSSFTLRENGIQVQKKNCSDQPVDFSLLFNKVDSVKWDFGDPASANNFSTALETQHAYSAPGNYRARAIIYSKCIADTATTMVSILADKITRIPDFIKDTVVCVGDKLNLDVTSRTAIKYSWENGLIYPQRTIEKAGHYSITIMSECSVQEKSFDVKFENCPCEVYIPNAFTPNADGANDVFRPVLRCHVQDYDFKVFHRYGGLVFHTTEAGKGWNGMRNSLQLPTGAYTWFLRYKDPNGGKLITKNGVVMLIR